MPIHAALQTQLNLQKPGQGSANEEDYYDLGSFHRAVTTNSRQAQTWFDRGLVWCFGFNHEEAVACFERAISHDADCAMAYWGLAYALGPNYNKPWDLFENAELETAGERTHEAVEKATEKSAAASPVEKALIEALRKRYQEGKAPTEEEWSIWNAGYANAMENVSKQFPNDLDVAALYADSLMNLTPWNLWDIHTSEPTEGSRTLDAKRVLDDAIAQDGGSQHPGLLHLYIHLIEMSKTPEAGLPAADALRRLVPDAGHLNHMPSHLDILVGDYANGVQANTDAVAADEKYLAKEGAMNFYTLYRSHDYHFRLYAAMFSGQSAIALDTVSKLEASISDELLRVESPPMADWLEGFLAMRLHALIRFGKWKDVLELKIPEDKSLYSTTTALTFYAKGMAHAALGQVDEAKKERENFQQAAKNVQESRTLFNNKCVDIIKVGEAMLEGEIEYRARNYDQAFAHLEESIKRYDNLPYDEPWGWMQPARHAYGALLLEQGRVEDALAVYKADLGFDDSLPRCHQHPNNVWALHGYHECLVKLDKKEEAAKIQPILQKALEVADISISSSCFCRTKCHA